MPQLKEGSIISHYRILSQLGAGGMGEVYLAQDMSLERNVALKTLPAEVSSDRDRLERFVREAKAASALSHPNIAHVYEIGEADGIHFMAMEYIEGKTLSAEISEGLIETAQLIEIGIQVADALHDAHLKGIIHRDVKPANILLTTSQRIKILDFGLAKVLHPNDPAQVTDVRTLSATTPGAVLGTVPYMSPEQLRGIPLDQRTDIFSFGVLLYQLATGRAAFARPTAAETIEQILLHRPEPVARLNYSVPAELERIIMKCMEKDRKHRYQSAQEIVIDLRNLQRSLQIPVTTAAQPSRPSIVVLPFDDLSPQKDHEYFSDGLTDEIITDLSQIEQLRVISRTSAMTLKGTAKNIKTIARELNVNYVVEGTVRKSGNRLRITAQLIDAVEDTQLLATKQNGTLDQVFDLQEEVSRSIVQALNVHLTPQQTKRLGERPIRNLLAYESYLRARHALWSWTPDAFAVAEKELRKAMDLEGKSELLYATLGWMYVMKVETGLQDEDYLHKADESLSQVLQLNPDSPYASSLQGVIRYKKGDIRNAVKNLKQANLLSPNDPDTLAFLMYCYALAGRQSIAQPLGQKLLQMDPLTPINHCVVGFLEWIDGRFDSALQYYRKARDLGSDLPAVKLYYAWSLASSMRNDEAAQILDELAAAEPQTVFARFGSVLKHALQRDKQRTEAAITAEMERTARHIEYFSRLLSECYALIGANAEALQWLENDVRLGFINYPFLAEHNPFFKDIKNDARFQQILARVKSAWERFDE